MPKTLFEETGLRIVKNENNSFAICTLHFSADPAKRSAEWKREASAGLTPEKFAREYNIDYTAVMGSRVFPEFTTNKSEIIVSSPLPDFGPHQKYWGGFDYGTRNPSSFHVYTISDGVTYSVWELYHPCKNIGAFAEEMRKFPYWNSIRYIAADRNIWAATAPQKDGILISVQELFYNAGIKNFVKGSQDEDAWVGMMRKHWAQPEECTFKIFDTCPNQIREFEAAVYTNQSERQLLTASYKETIADVDNHSLDDCKYFMLSRPAQHQHSTWKDPIMVNRWAIPTGSSSSSNPRKGSVGGYR